MPDSVIHSQNIKFQIYPDMKKLMLSLAVAAVAFGASAAEAVVAVFAVNPPMSCQNCENKIKSNLRYEKGVKKIVTSIKDQKVTVTYDPAKTSPEKLISGFSKIGYEALEYDGDKAPVFDRIKPDACAPKPAKNKK